jgi:hypothetical protein
VIKSLIVASLILVFAVGVNAKIDPLCHVYLLNARNIKALEERMRPGFRDKDYYGAESGFIGENEDLKDLLARDDETVKQMGLSHEKLAEPLLNLIAQATKKEGGGGSLVLNGAEYTLSSLWFGGTQESPFGDGQRTGADYIVTNEKTGKKIRFSGLLPYFISKYGFYEGREIHKSQSEFKFLLERMRKINSPPDRIAALEKEMNSYLTDSYRLDPKVLAQFLGYVP